MLLQTHDFFRIWIEVSLQFSIKLQRIGLHLSSFKKNAVP